MCGIAGYMDLREGVDIETLEKMTKIISYRGPDDEGYVLFDTSKDLELSGDDTVKELNIKERICDQRKKKDFFLGFGHRRLSIIDTSSAGHQPMLDKKNNLVITFNGEIYNYIEIKEELKELGHIFKTGTDTEVVLKAYHEWGEECVEHFNGMWSFCIYDKTNDKLFCSRDRLGAKPFYYFIVNDHFVFGSEIKEICQDKHLKREINKKELAILLTTRIQGYSEETLLKNVYALPAGHNLIVSFDLKKKKILEITKKKYWDLKINNCDVISKKWYGAICEAVKIRLRSDVPIGIMVSGGIDSTFLADIAYRYINGKKEYNLNTYTTCYKNDDKNDETKYAHMVNKAIHANEHLIYPDTDDGLKAYEKMIWHYEGYAGISTLGAFLTMEKVAETGIKVIINGQGGDESMLGYERYYVYYILDLIKSNPIKAITIIPEIVKNSKLSIIKLLEYIVYFGIPSFRININNRRASNFISKELMKEFPRNEVMSLFRNKSINDLVYNEIRKTQLPNILRMDDRGYMAFSLESRVPFIDYKYIEAAVNIDPLKKVKGGYTKYLLREKISDIISKEVIWRKNKNGWSSSTEKWIKKFDKKRIEKILDDSKAKDYFNMSYIRKIWREKPCSQEFALFLFTEIFIRKFIYND